MVSRQEEGQWQTGSEESFHVSARQYEYRTSSACEVSNAARFYVACTLFNIVVCCSNTPRTFGTQDAKASREVFARKGSVHG